MVKNTQNETTDMVTLAELEAYVLVDRDTGEVMRSPAIGSDRDQTSNLDVLIGRRAAYAAAAEWGRENVEAVPVTITPKGPEQTIGYVVRYNDDAEDLWDDGVVRLDDGMRPGSDDPRDIIHLYRHYRDAEYMARPLPNAEILPVVLCGGQVRVAEPSQTSEAPPPGFIFSGYAVDYLDDEGRAEAARDGKHGAEAVAYRGRAFTVPTGLKRDGEEIEAIATFIDKEDAHLAIGVHQLDEAIVYPMYEPIKVYKASEPQASRQSPRGGDDDLPAITFRELTTIVDAIHHIVDMADAAYVVNHEADEQEGRDGHYSRNTTGPCESDTLDELVHRRFGRNLHQAMIAHDLPPNDFGSDDVREAGVTVVQHAHERLRQVLAVLSEYHEHAREKWLAQKND